MPLKITLKPKERLFIGSATVLVVTDRLTDVIVDGGQPVLRERDYLAPDHANTVAKKLYLAIQSAYLYASFDAFQSDYLQQVAELLASKKEASPYVTDVNTHLNAHDLYKALRAARLLVQWDEGASWTEIVSA